MSEARIHYSKPFWWTEIERRDRKTREMVKAEGWRFYGDYTYEKDKLKAAGVPMFAWWTDKPLSASPFTEEMDDDAKAAMVDAQQEAEEARRREAEKDYGTVHYSAPFWWVWIKRNNYQMKDLFKGEGWRFHGDRSYAKERLEDAGVPEMAWYTDQPTSAAPFRDQFDADARGAFKETVQDDEQSRAADADIDVPCPEGMSYLPYQRAGIKWISERQSTLLGDQMGLGKTVQVLGAINADESIRNVLCVVPASLTANWAREAQKWLTRPAMIVNLKTAYDVPDPAPAGEINFLITNYERLIDQKGKDEKKILATDGIAQKDETGIRRALQKMRKEPSLRDVLVVAERPDKLDVKKALKPPRNADDWPEAEVYIANDLEELREVVGRIRGGSSAIIAQHDRNKGLQVRTPDEQRGPAHVVIIPIDKNDKQHTFIRQALNEHKWHILVKDQIHVLVTRGRGFGLHAKLLEYDFDLLACDEAHVMSNPKSKQTIAVVGKEVRKGARSKAKTGIAAAARKLVFATGTPIRNKPVETWPILHALAPKTFPEFFPFAKRYCGAVQNGWGWDFSGATRRAEYEHVLRTGTEHHGLMIRRLKEDVLTDLPPKFRHVVPLEVDTPEIEAVMRAEQEIYDKYRKEVEKMIGSGAPSPKQRGQIVKYAEEVGKLTEAGPIPFAEIAKVKAMVGAAKVEPAARLIAQMLEGGDEKVVVFGEHYAVIDGLEEALKEYGVVQITGRTPNADRMKIVDQFQTDKNTRVFIGNIKAAGVGLTLTAASTVVMVEATWVPALNEQAEDRCHRIGTVDNVNVLYLVFDGSIDQMVLEKVVAKMEVARDMLDAKITEVEKVDVEAMYQELEEAIEVGEI